MVINGGGLGVTEASLIRSNLFLVNQGKVVLHIIQQFVFCGLKCVNVRILMKVGIENFINKTVFTKDFLKAPCTVCVIVPGQIKVHRICLFCEVFLKTSTTSVFFSLKNVKERKTL